MDDKISTAAEAWENSAIPRRLELHADPAARPAAPLPAGVSDRPLADKSPAEWAFERVILFIQDFERRLDSDHEVAMGFAGGEAGVLRIEGLGYFDPDILTFHGSDASGARMQLVQHISQLNVALRALPKMVSTDAPRRIGFRLMQDLENN